MMSMFLKKTRSCVHMHCTFTSITAHQQMAIPTSSSVTSRPWLQWCYASLLIIVMGSCHGFAPIPTSRMTRVFGCRTSPITDNISTSSSSSSTSLFALTERQMQFWEDVDEGLNDIEAFYQSSKGMDIDRVRRFTQRYANHY